MKSSRKYKRLCIAVVITLIGTTFLYGVIQFCSHHKEMAVCHEIERFLTCIGKFQISSWYEEHTGTLTAIAIAVIVGLLYLVIAEIRSSRREKATRHEIRQVRRDIQDFLDGLPVASDTRKKSLFERGMVARDSSRYDEARDLFRGILSLNPSPAEKVAVLILVGNSFVVEGRLEEAQGSYREALKLARQHDISDGEAAALGNIGMIYSDEKKFDEAVKYHLKALEIYREVGNHQGEANALRNLGLIYAESEKLDAALHYHQDALKIYREIDDRQGEATELVNLGWIYSHKGELDEAVKSLETAQKIFQSVGSKNNVDNIQKAIEEIHRETGSSSKKS